MESHFLRTRHTTFSAKRSDIAKNKKIAFFVRFDGSCSRGKRKFVNWRRGEPLCVSFECVRTSYSGPSKTRPTTFDGGLAAKKVSQVNRCF